MPDPRRDCRGRPSGHGAGDGGVAGPHFPEGRIQPRGAGGGEVGVASALGGSRRPPGRSGRSLGLAGRRSGRPDRVSVPAGLAGGAAVSGATATPSAVAVSISSFKSTSGMMREPSSLRRKTRSRKMSTAMTFSDPRPVTIILPSRGKALAGRDVKLVLVLETGRAGGRRPPEICAGFSERC